MKPRHYGRSYNLFHASLALVLCAGLTCAGTVVMPGGAAWAQSLKTIRVPDVPGLNRYVKDRAAAIQLGKALFWDMQVGSDGVTACASCHFHAGADNRVKGQLNPGTLGGDDTFQAGDPNTTLTRADFPFVQFEVFHDAKSTMVRDWNDVVSSQGVRLTRFDDIVPGSAEDAGTPINDPVFAFQGQNTRRVEPRNTPTVINAVFNFANFFDGRANNVFNGVNPFGAADPDKKILANVGGVLTPVLVRLRNSALASQAVGPPLSDFEMSWRGRTMPKVGKKMLSLKPLAKQVVHPQDSVLGLLSKSTLVNGVPADVKGIKTNYAAMIKKAFARKYWNNTTEIVTFDANGLPTTQPHPGTPLTTDQYTQMEANFSLFFGLAVQLYESTLIADDSPFDRFFDGFANALTPEQLFGMAIFQGVGRCTVCHLGAETTGASVDNILKVPFPVPPGKVVVADPRKNPLAAMELMDFVSGTALYDVDFLSISVTRVSDDVGRDGTAPFINPLTNEEYPLSWSKLALLKRDGLLPPSVAAFTPDLPLGFLGTDTSPTPDREIHGGAMKVPQLRNIDLTGPYFHNGGAATFMQVVDFYTRGGNFPDLNAGQLPLEIAPIGFLRLRSNEGNQKALMAFLKGLTDPRVAEESAPFDHPQLFVPNGVDATNADIMTEIPAIGLRGRALAGLPPLQPFLNVNQITP